MNAVETAAISRLAEGIGYPQSVPVGTVDFVFVVDGHAVRAETADGRLTVSCALTGEEQGDCPPMRLAEYAAGRMLKEDAVLSWDAARGGLFLWQACDASWNERRLRSFFTDFLNSLDWWLERAGEQGGEPIRPGEMIIRP